MFNQSFLLCLIAALVNCKLSILSPSSLASLFPNGEIEASYANFGFIPYGHTIIGKLYYDEQDQDICEDLPPQTFTEDYDGDITPFFIAKRGSCSFVSKVRSIEDIGASVAIIVDNNFSDDIKNIIMSDDGTGSGIRIPSMLISEDDGLKLIDYLETQDKQSIDSIAIQAEFIMESPDNRVEYDLWYSSSNDRMLDFISDFKDKHFSLKDKVLMTPRYVFWSCFGCDDSFLKDNCYANGRYCAYEYSNSAITGTDIIDEDIREKCLWQLLQGTRDESLWWDYISETHESCFNDINLDCSKQAHSQLGLDFAKTKQCYDDSWSSTNKRLSTTENSIIHDEIEYMSLYGTNLYPSIVINNRTYRGQIEEESVFNAICAGFQKPPKQCRSYLDKHSAGMKKVFSMRVIFTIIVAVIIINLIVVVLYRRHAKREMNQEMQVQIESAVSQYFALANTSN